MVAGRRGGGGPDRSEAIWALHDIVIWPGGMRLDGFGHYHETYVEGAEGWRIESSRLTRLHADFVVPEVD